MEAMQRNIIDTLGVTADIDPSTEIQRRVDFLASYLESVPGAKGFVLGISGGQDSTLAGKLAQLAVEQARQSGRDAEFVAVRLPYSVQRDEDDAQLALSFIGADHVMTVNIASAVDALADELNDAFSASQLDSRVTDFNKGNIKARMRMVAQYGIAGERGLLVIGTDHAAEAVTGFFTKFGDGAADVVPLAGLTKSQGAVMLEHLGADPRLWQKVPTADLLDEDPGQSDEESLGVSYAEIDRYLTGGTISEDAQRSLEQKYRASEHKRRLPVSVSDTWWQRSETFVLAGGCFWCLDTAYRALDGVLEVVSAYTGGHTPNPSYEQVCTGATGHAEAVAVKFDPSVIPAEVILDAFFTMHNPTQLNRQGNDVGTQYRSAMFYSGKEQRVLFEAALQRAQTWWPEPIVTTLEPLGELFPAEDYHQDFFAKNPTQGYCLAVAVPKVNKIRQTFTKYLK